MSIFVGGGIGATVSTALSDSANLARLDAANVFTLAQRFPAGTSSVPSINFGDTDTGIYGPFAGYLEFVSNGARVAAFSNGIALEAVAGFTLQWISTTSIGGISPDLFVGRQAAANLRLGNIASATPVAQTLSVQDGVGTDISGVPWTLRASRGTGAGAPGRILLAASAAALGSSATLQTAVTHLDIGAGYVKLGSGVNLRQSNDTVRITDGGVFRSSDNTAGISGTFTLAGLVSFTVKDGIVTGTA